MIIITKIETELGIMIAGAVDDGICLLEFSDRRMLNTEYKDLERYLKTTITEGESHHFIAIRKELNEYFEGYTKGVLSSPCYSRNTFSAGSVERTFKYPLWDNPFIQPAISCSGKT